MAKPKKMASARPSRRCFIAAREKCAENLSKDTSDDDEEEKEEVPIPKEQNKQQQKRKVNWWEDDDFEPEDRTKRSPKPFQKRKDIPPAKKQKKLQPKSKVEWPAHKQTPAKVVADPPQPSSIGTEHTVKDCEVVIVRIQEETLQKYREKENAIAEMNRKPVNGSSSLVDHHQENGHAATAEEASKEEPPVVQSPKRARVTNENQNDCDISGNVSATDFGIQLNEYPTVCYDCKRNIGKNQVKIKATDHDSLDEMFGMSGYVEWYHVHCFVRRADQLKWFERPEKLPGFENLSERDQIAVSEQFPSSSNNDCASTPDPT